MWPCRATTTISHSPRPTSSFTTGRTVAVADCCGTTARTTGPTMDGGDQRPSPSESGPSQGSRREAIDKPVDGLTVLGPWTVFCASMPPLASRASRRVIPRSTEQRTRSRLAAEDARFRHFCTWSPQKLFPVVTTAPLPRTRRCRGQQWAARKNYGTTPGEVPRASNLPPFGKTSRCKRAAHFGEVR